MLHAGDVLAGRYQLVERVGGGGMGDVWRGEDILLRRTVAVKVLLARLADASNFRERFRREARAIAALEGPGIVDVYDYGEETVADGTVAYLIMQFVDGMALSRRLAGWGRLNTQDTLRIVSQVADSLEIAHRSGIIHRDVKPGNILVRADGRVVLVDFGIARTDNNLTLTTTGVVLGTVTYMSPEQASGDRLGPASDIYSLGVVAHQCLAGQPPFKADTPLAVLSAHLRDVPPRLPADVPRPVPELVSRAMAKEPQRRWASAGQFADACRHAVTVEQLVPVPAFAGASSTDDVPRVRQSAPPATADPVPLVEAELPVIGFDAPKQRTLAPASGAVVTLNPTPVPVPVPVSEPVTPAPSAVAESGEATPPVTEPPQSPPSSLPPSSSPPQPPPPPKRRRLRQLGLITAVLVALMGAVAMAIWPLDQISSSAPGDGAALTRSQNASEGDRDAADGGEAGTEPGDKKKKKKEKDSSASPGAEDTTSDSDEPTTASSSPAPATVTVPDVMGRNEGDARSELTAAGLRPAVIYDGEGDHACAVTAQDPAAGREVRPDSTVTVTIRKAKDGCDK